MKSVAYKFIFCISLLFLFNLSCFASSTITVENDNDSTYVPTNIVNGSFEEEPWMDYEINGTLYTTCPHTEANLAPTKIYFNGVNQGWNTTETTIWKSNIFEVTNGLNNHTYRHNSNIALSDKYVEMNNTQSAMLYQDLYTNGDDVILWKLKHGMTITSISQNGYVQTMRVEIGAPNKSNGTVIDAHGVANNINPEIDLSTKAIYRSTGVTDSDGNLSKLGYPGSDIDKLYLTYPDNSTKWYTASGIYVVPKGQDITRFGFISESKIPNMGNLLDDIVFSTLIGNLNAVYNNDKSATVTGYWGEVDSSKKLVIKIGDNTYNLDMSNISGNFKFDISEEMIGKETYIEVYHEDYEQVKKVVRIVAGDILRKKDESNKQLDIISSDEVIINSFDNETINKIKHGESLEIWVEINNVSDIIDAELKTLFSEQLENYILGDIYDISIYKKLESDEKKIKVTETNELLEFSLKLPDELVSEDIEGFKIVRVHDDDLSVLEPQFDKNTNTLIFKSDKFSEYALLYKKKEKIANPITGDNVSLYFVIGIISIIGIVGSIIFIKKK